MSPTATQTTRDINTITLDEIDLDQSLLRKAVAIRSDVSKAGSLLVALDEANKFLHSGMARDDALHQGVEMVEAALREVVASKHAWNDDPELRDRLETAGWRYANLIGVTSPDEQSEPEMLQALNADQAAHGHLVRTHLGLPEWHSKEATGFVAEVAGTSRQIAAAWLDYDWSGGGEA